MQQWIDKSVLQNDNTRTSHFTLYDSPAAPDAASEGNSFHLSPVHALANDDSGLAGVSTMFPQQSGVVEQCLQSVNLADLLLNAACTTTAHSSSTQQPLQADSIQQAASQLPGGQMTYGIWHYCGFQCEM